ncbi:MAG: glycine--tRNA ligase subunit beta [Candidatus Aminicenantes bacterium]|nr:glycine--tRNA ligase subunit beta [Candidatus Aminicenantes bacterium]
MDFLLELMTEEMPFEHITSGLDQIRNKMEAELRDSNVNVYRIISLGTCRRLVIQGDFSEKQEDLEDTIVGPPKAAAFSAEGIPLPPAEGFARSQGVDVADLSVIETRKGEYIGLKRVRSGKKTSDILADILPKILSSISFPKMMRWGTGSLRFSRPIRNLVCLFGEKIVPFSLESIDAGEKSKGHKILQPEVFKVRNYDQYKEDLKLRKVLIDPDERRKNILKQIEKLLVPLEGNLHPDKELLNKLVYDVEFPFAFFGEFPQEYLKLPLEVLSTALREGQRLFSVVQGKKQIPYFVGVADTSGDSKSLIKKGNERVLKARLEDARFFWRQDLKIPLKTRAKELNRILFQEDLGSYEEKISRIKKVASYLIKKLDAEKEKLYLTAAAELCKADLLTEMVNEFPSLQGKIGGLYAREEKYPSAVWKAIYEHYLPLGLEDGSPSTTAGAILSLSDKMDSIIGQLGVGIQVSGSKDPFGLRRAALGVCKIILDQKMSFSFPRLLDKVLKGYDEKLKIPAGEIKNYCLSEFFPDRLRYVFERQGFRYDLIAASMAADLENVFHAYLRLKALDSVKDSPAFEPMILIVKRVNNILRGQPSFRINPELLIEKEERELFTTFSIIKNNTRSLMSNGDFEKAQRIVFRMSASINKFFDKVLVMAEDKHLQRNRLALLQGISRLFLEIADYSKVVVAGE